MIANPALLHYILLITQYGYGLLFLLSVFVGPLIAAVGGYLVALGYMNGFLVFGALFAADIAGDICFYALGRWGGSAFAERFGRGRIGEKYILKGKAYFLRYDWKILVFGKTQITFLPTGILILFSAGLFRMSFIKYILANAAASIPKILILELIGFHFGSALSTVTGRVFGYTTFISLLIAAMLVATSFMFSSYLARKEKEWERTS